VQLALEILTGVCATLPDPDVEVEVGADDEDTEDDVFEDSFVDDSAMDDGRDDAMAVDGAALKPHNADTLGAPSFLPTLLEPLLALIQPTELSFPALSPHPPTTSALSAIHIAAFECLSNAFLALAAAPGSAASDAQVGLRVWGAVWAALGGVGSPVEETPRTRQTVWDVAAGLLWGVGVVWTGKIVRVICNARVGMLTHGVVLVLVLFL